MMDLHQNSNGCRFAVSAAVLRLTSCLVILAVGAPILGQPPEKEGSGPVSSLLPAPTGPHSIACMRFHWTDRSRPETATPDPSDHRELFIQLWYPCAKHDGKRRHIPYFREPELYVPFFGEGMTETLSQVETHSVADGEFDSNLRDVPVVLFCHGWQAQAAVYTALLESLTSYGFVVAAIEQPYQGRIAMTDGRVTPATEKHFDDPMTMVRCYGRDHQFVLDRLSLLNEEGAMFSGQLAMDRVGSMGHSNGALGALQVSQSDERVKACLALDKWDPVFESVFDLRIPLALLRTGSAPSPSEAFVDSRGGPFYDIMVTGGDHLSPTDWPLLKAPDSQDWNSAARTLSAIQRCVVVFFQTHLKNRGNGGIDELAQRELIHVNVSRK